MDELDVLQRNEDNDIVTTSSKMPRRLNPVYGVHADGRDDYMDASAGARLRAEETKLQRRIESHCRPRNLLGCFSIFVRRRRLLRKLRTRFEVPYAMFVAQNGTQEGKRVYDALNDYGLGRATIPTSVGGGILKVILSWFRQ